MVLFILSFVLLTALSTGSIYNPEIEICCDGQINPVTSRFSFQCCGTEAYNDDTSRCCDGKVLDLPRDENGKINKSLECCGETWFQRGYSSEEKGCCKNKIYHVRTQVCDSSTYEVIEKTTEKDLAHCDGKLYNTSYQICDSSNIVNDKRTYVVCDKGPSKGPLHCCGNTSYYWEQDQCCIDTIHPKYSALFDRNFCCGRNVYPVNRFSYITKFACCDGNVFEKTFPSEECCGSKLYNFNTTGSLCCKDVIVEDIPLGHLCCGDTTYNPKTSICCKGTIYPLSFSEQSCCYDFKSLQDFIHASTELGNMNVQRCLNTHQTNAWYYD